MAAASKSDSQICFRSYAWIEKEKALHAKCVPKKTAHPNLASAFLFQSSGSNGKLWWVQSSHVAQAVQKGKRKVEKKSQAAYFVSKIFRGKVADDTGIWTSAVLNLMIPPVIKKNSFQATLQKVESSPLVTPAMWLWIFWDEHWLFGQEAARCGEEGIYSVFLNKPYNWHCGKRKVHTHTKSKIQAYQNLSFQQLSVWRTAFSWKRDSH